MSSSEGERTIAMRTSDGTFMEVEVAVATEMANVRAFLDEKTAAATTTTTSSSSSSTNTPIIVPLDKVSSKELSKIVTYIRKYPELKGKPGSFDEIRAYEDEFLKDQSDYVINKEMIPAAYYLDIKYLYDMLNNDLDTRLKNQCAGWARESVERARMTTQPRRYVISVRPYVVYYSWY